MLRRLPGLLGRLGSAASGSAASAAASAAEASVASIASASAPRAAAAGCRSRLFSSEAKGAHSVLDEVAQARLKRIKSQLEATGELPVEPPSGGVWGAIRMLWRGALLGGAGLGATAAYYTYAYDTKELVSIVKQTRTELKAEEKPNPLRQLWCDGMQRYLLLRHDLESRIKDFTDPATDKLLPDQHPAMKGAITLVLDLDEVLVWKEWTRQRGWSIYKRPGVQEFLLEMAQYYEIVVYTDEPYTYADPILNKFDPQRVAVMHRLYRTDTQYLDGKHVRDLSKINRDLSHVLMISAKPEAWALQPSNTLKLKPWKGEPGDTGLIDLIPFLQFLAMRRVKDVRDVVKSYDGVDDIPAAFRARLQEAAAHQRQGQRRPSGFLAPR
ncbi:hypothetical protein HXX76_000467 [Chlamydomonas incerta]|uniref:Mitochondrial import inner membrane translocase subunit TIM50 n=1 Tax=Chlamydomonas incerta TaxID=51695 RepID=A0A835WEG2_CHLIN|nr:hypothetical protein HXX76_000467 [Chlamydomonas incerta]|eukprot:KAG2445863.1 hypothetical protein HXX76_000467 [Chlamydomonas incerta]